MSFIAPLESLRAGQSGHVFDIHGDETLAARLAENGFRVGAKVEMLVAGDPMVVLVGQSRLSLRLDTQVSILVEADTDNANGNATC